MLKVSGIEKGTIAEELKLKVGDEIIAFDGKPARDVLDYIYYDGQNSFDMKVRRGKKEFEYEIDKCDDETLGIEFENGLQMATCKNNCTFCFVSQLPKGMRETLYVKDDDVRMSLICGNFVTLTNLSEEEFARIERMKMSPLYISVHATDPEVRIKMLRNPNAGKLESQMRRLSDAGIKMHCQIVLCPGVNDGETLQKTLQTLRAIEGVLTAAVVPVGLTKFRQGLSEIPLVDRETARECIRMCDALSGEKSFFCSDEMYLKAGLAVKEYREYGDFAQIENGVGLIAKFLYEVEHAEIEKVASPISAAVVTGVSAAETIRRAAEIVSRKSGAQVEVIPVENEFFGRSITVAGLVTGGDILRNLQGKNLPERIVLPHVMLREFEDVFLDGIRLSQLKSAIQREIAITDGSGQDFAHKILYGDR